MTKSNSTFITGVSLESCEIMDWEKLWPFDSDSGWM
jgi:hypothetical protein